VCLAAAKKARPDKPALSLPNGTGRGTRRRARKKHGRGNACAAVCLLGADRITTMSRRAGTWACHRAGKQAPAELGWL